MSSKSRKSLGKTTVSATSSKKNSYLKGITIEADFQVYELLKEKGPLTRPQLMGITRIVRSTLYDILMRLKLKNHIKQYSNKPEGRPGRPKAFFAVIEK